MKTLLPFALLSTVFISGCGTVSPIQKYDESTSGFDLWVGYGHTRIQQNEEITGVDKYRIYMRGGTGFVRLATLLNRATLQADKFCQQRNKHVYVIEILRNHPFPAPANFPRVEVVFQCIDNSQLPAEQPSNSMAEELERLKKLRDDGTLTPEEFEAAKKKAIGAQ